MWFRCHVVTIGNCLSAECTTRYFQFAFSNGWKWWYIEEKKIWVARLKEGGKERVRIRIRGEKEGREEKEGEGE